MPLHYRYDLENALARDWTRYWLRMLENYNITYNDSDGNCELTFAYPSDERKCAKDDDEGMSDEDLDESQKMLFDFLGISETK